MSALKHRDDSAPVTIGSFDSWPQLHGAWYADPFGEGDLRWWDGTSWTGDVKAGDDVVSDGADDVTLGGAGQRRPARFHAAFLAALGL